MMTPQQTPLRSTGLSAQPRRIAELGEYTFKIADLPQEFDKILRLLYRTFVVDVPLYDDPVTDYLVDKFHERNVYLIALRNGNVCGMMAVHDQPPFSVAAAIEDPNILDRLGPRLIEVRTFAVEPQERLGVAFLGLACSIYEYAKSNRYGHIVVTEKAVRQEIYERLGFRALGPPTLRGHEHFVPMALDLSHIPDKSRQDLDRWSRRTRILRRPIDTG